MSKTNVRKSIEQILDMTEESGETATGTLQIIHDFCVTVLKGAEDVSNDINKGTGESLKSSPEGTEGE